MAVPSQACVPPQAARHLRSPVLLQSTTDTFTFPQTPASPDQTLMEEDVATPKVSDVSTEVSTKTKKVIEWILLAQRKISHPPLELEAIFHKLCLLVLNSSVTHWRCCMTAIRAFVCSV